MSKVMDVQCPSCFAPVKYNAKLACFKCEYCGNEFQAEDVKSKNYDKEKDNVVEEESKVEKAPIDNYDAYVSYNCPDCGAQIIADENTSATFCVYCGNTAILKNRLEGSFRPTKIIPFVKTKEDAMEAFKSLSKGRILMPKSFNSLKNVEKITGIYIPFWLFEIKAVGGIYVNATKVTSWSSGSTHYTKTDYYDVARSGKMIFKRVPVDGSKKFDDNLMNTLEPFYFHYLKDYNHAYLSGYLAEKYDVDQDAAFPAASARALESAKQTFLSDCTGYSSKAIKENTLISQMINTEYVLLPVFMVNVKYQDKYYTFAMNGQTGEFVGDIPLDKGKTALFGILIFVAVFLLTVLITAIVYLF